MNTRSLVHAVLGTGRRWMLAALLLTTAVDFAQAQLQREPRTVQRRRVAGADTTFLHRTQDVPYYRHVPNQSCLAMIRQAKTRFSEIARLRLRPDSTIRRVSTDTLFARVRACADQDDSIRRDMMFELMKEELLRAARVHNDIPEYHDEQRLATGERTAGGLMKLGPVAAIYASPFLGDFQYLWQVNAHRSPGILAAYVVVIQENSEALPASYRALNLQFGMNCIFLRATSSMRPAYAMNVTHPKPDTPCRDEHGMTLTPVGELPVVVTPTGFTQRDMITAARFLDDSTGKPVLGFPCLGDWCQVGAAGFVPLKQTYCDWFTPSPANVPCEANPEARIPSWYDEQYLDEKIGNDWVSTHIRAAIVPQPQISRFSDADFTDTLRHVANLYIKDELPDTHRLYVHGVRRGENRVELRRIAATRVMEVLITPITNPLPVGIRPIAFGVLGPHRHWDAPVPGTARFRYTQRDPGIWSACGSSCCRTDGT